MKIVCIHCGGEFTIRAEDLGGEGMCPHCRGLIVLPKATRAAPAAAAPRQERERPTNWLDGALSGLISLMLHMTAFLALALLQASGGQGGAGEGEEVQIGVMPVRDLIDRPEEQLSAAEVEKQQSSALDSPIEVEVPSPATSAAAGSEGELSTAALSASGGEVGSFDLGSVQIASGSGGGGSWEGLLGTLRRQGLDVVLCFDSTGSMGGEIDQVKRQMERIGQTLVTLVPKTRIGVCTYRDRGDEYVVKGLPLTTSIQDVSTYLGHIRAGGGGDHPEAVDEGLYWCSSQNQFRPTARKVILLFGDAPPHPDKLQRCLKLAGEFRQAEKGIISTVTCRANSPLPAFYEIATAGGGEAFLTTNQREIMTQLMVLVFGSQHRQKVIEAFKLLER